MKEVFIFECVECFECFEETFEGMDILDLGGGLLLGGLQWKNDSTGGRNLRRQTKKNVDRLGLVFKVTSNMSVL